MIAQNITDLIGNTPLLKISNAVTGLKNINLYAKLELFNPFGSLKDRIAWGIIKNDIKDIVKNKKTIIESSSGNTAKALAVLASINDIEFTTVTNRINVAEVKKILQLIGANIQEVPGVSECPDFTDPDNPISIIEKELGKYPEKYYHTDQYKNKRNYLSHYETTGPEILNDLKEVNYFIATLGTTGSSRGTAEYLKEKNVKTKVIGVLSTKDDFIPGIRNEDEKYEVGLYKKELYTELEYVTSSQAIDDMLILIRKVGVLAGPTSGACFNGALKYLSKIDKKLKSPKNAVFVVCDRVEWYMSYIEKRMPEIFSAQDKCDTIYNFTPTLDIERLILPVAEISNWKKQKNAIIVDLRGAVGFKNFHIEGSINIFENTLAEMMSDGIPFSKDHKILFVCPVGKKSLKFASFLDSLGYHARSLEGGLTQYFF
jgi:cysteine synthase B